MRTALVHLIIRICIVASSYLRVVLISFLDILDHILLKKFIISYLVSPNQ